MSATLLRAQANCTQDVLAAARRGDKDAFTDLISPHAPNLQRLARRLTRNTEDAEDACQESLLKAFTKLNQFAGTQEAARDDFRSWLMKITVNSAIDFVRRKQACRIVPLEECAQVQSKSYEAGAAGWGENPETSYARQERICMVVDAMKKLPVELRDVCHLRNVMELSTKEVAARLGISTIAVRLRLFRAYAQLRKNLGLVSKDGGQDRPAAQPRKARYGSARRNDDQVLLRFHPEAERAYGD